MPVNWKEADAFTRLLAAMVAAQDMKLDYRKIATMYGKGATYDSIEGRFRIIKKEAAVLKSEIDTGARPEAPARGKDPNSTTSTPKKPKNTTSTPKKDKTVSGRVSKSTNITPTKKGGNSVKGIKEEPDSSINGFLSESIWEEDGEIEGEGEGDWTAAGMMDANEYFGMDEGV
ncbi:hypothetical protein N7G274_005559 [Stereocaulon virgatum]|uniref:Uncharacterized protein n=1 Tax=Stereocaulon virgatum TaxID=373712 RepID=A0ABR4A9I8_9LECA